MNENEIRKALKSIIKKYLEKQLTKEQVVENLILNVDCEKIYSSDNLLISDSYFALSHILEENIKNEELKYLMDCLEGRREYSLNDKLKFCSNGLEYL